ncbi:MAG TPA: hypothetical protein VEC16_00200 [Alphaproteobacteria bacterium]|nr:hypothetical protein [Alphaproteobacteria bacterium]
MSYHYGYSGSGNGGILGRGIMAMQNAGIADIILPFILIFTLVFAILQKTKILGVDDDTKKPRKNFNVVVALVMGLGVVIPHVTGSYPSPNMDVVNIINTALPNISVVIVAVIMLLLMIGAFGGDVNIAGSNRLAGYAVFFSIAVTIFIFGTAAYWWNLPAWASFMLNPDLQALIVIILVFGVIISFITGDDEPKKDKPGLFDELAKVMKK